MINGWFILHEDNGVVAKDPGWRWIQCDMRRLVRVVIIGGKGGSKDPRRFRTRMVDPVESEGRGRKRDTRDWWPERRCERRRRTPARYGGWFRDY